MEINKTRLERSMDLLDSNKMIDRLNQVYARIPSGKCNGCAKCCTEAVHAFYTEFLNIYRFVVANDLLDQVMERVENHYFNELVEKKNCPFLEADNTCLIYPVRPHVCRLFGHASKEEHEANYENILAQNLDADAYFFDTFGVHLSEEVIYHKIDFCEFFSTDTKFSQNDKLELIDDLFMLDTQFLMEEVIDDDMLNMSITNWFIYTKYTEEEASERRIERLTNCKI